MMKHRLSWVVGAMAVVGGVLVAAMLLLITVNVVTRYVFNVNIVGVIELTEFALLLITMLVAPWVLLIDKHVRVDLVSHIVGKRSEKAERILASVADGLSTVVCGVVTYESLIATITVFTDGVRSIAFLPVPLGPFYVAIPLCFLCMTVTFAYRTWRGITGRGSISVNPDAESGI